ncbi:LacI family DNA-binding transcriptional regulator [Ruegeria arenilitoris]|uniref:LacI family DNA-binding transcriptional regulator n=1 Tax=Ruegeria arenilitoris TaxID=1173585 RepID=UPI00147DCAFE|nr:LacI family DNA-binding transcriptional regulator [Ruegeria arenilitoris]MBY6084645.1 LacI family DNA-binding transcriptional regulator [Ruegeria arenilitoris]
MADQKQKLELVKKPTVNDIARVAGVSLATVDRVLNRRPGVRAVTVQKVQKAIDELGYVRDTAAANLARNRVYNFLFVLPDTDNEFVEAISNQIAEQSRDQFIERTRITIKRVAPFEPQDIVNILDAVDSLDVDGVAVFGPETPSVRDAVRRLKDKGVPVVALVSDLPSSERDHFVGIDNVSAGRTAGQLMGRFVHREGKVLVLTGSRLARDHLERRQGFDLVVAEEFPHLEVVASVEGRDDPDLIYKMMPEIFETYPDLVGIYSSAAGNAGLIQFLSENKLSKDLVIIAHELTPLSREALKLGTFDALISQDTGHIVRSAVRLLRATSDKVPFNKAQERIRIDIYLRENLPP